MNVIVSFTVVVCTCLTSLIYITVVLLLVVAEYRVHSVVVRAQDVSTRSSVHTRECVFTVVVKHVYSRVLAHVLSYYTHPLHKGNCQVGFELYILYIGNQV